MRSLRIPNLRICAIAGLLLVLISVAAGQPAKDNFLKFLTASAALTQADLASLGKGDLVVKVLPSRDKREVSVLAVVRLLDIQEIDLATFRAGVSQRTNKAVLGGGILSGEPGLQDLAELTLDDRDIEKLKICAVGDCDLKLSASMIRRFRTEIEWNAVDRNNQATDLFKKLLIDYARDYLKQGDRALIEYADKRKPVSLIDEYRVIMAEPTLVRSLAPELLDHLRKFPAADLPGTEGRLDWSKVDSGLKPIVTLTHSLGYSRRSSEDLFLTIATKQIYASHYIDASLAFTSFLRVGTGESAEAYLIFTSVSRSDSLGGALSGMAHSVVEREALQKAEDLLRSSKTRLEAKAPASQRSADEETDSTYSKLTELSKSLTARIFAVLILAGLAGLALRIWFRWRAGK